MNEQDDLDSACWAQQEMDERRQREDEALARHAVLLDESRREQAVFENECELFHQRMRKASCL